MEGAPKQRSASQSSASSSTSGSASTPLAAAGSLASKPSRNSRDSSGSNSRSSGREKRGSAVRDESTAIKHISSNEDGHGGAFRHSEKFGKVDSKELSAMAHHSTLSIRGRNVYHSVGDRMVHISRQLCGSWRFTALTTVLTVYALFGDDFRLAATSKKLDTMFDVFTLSCILVFCVEIFASSLGQDEYFLGFFFLLDVASTLTLFMDLSWISNALLCSNSEGGGELRTARAGRAGARAGRTVRIIRLIRLAKLYKTYMAQKEKNEEKKRAERDGVAPGENKDDSYDSEEDGEEELDEKDPTAKKNKNQSETRVGKKLSDMTTRRVIILVLVMLFAMPQFLPASHGVVDFRSSAYMGMEMVYERWRQWCPTNTSQSPIPWCLQWDGGSLDPVSIERYAEDRLWYEHYLLTHLYNHAGSEGFAWKLHWIGFNSSTLVTSIQKKEGVSRDAAVSLAMVHLKQVSRLGQKRYLRNFSEPSSSWNTMFSNENWQIPVKGLEAEVVKQLAGVWEEECKKKSFIGVALAPRQLGTDPALCSIDEELRCSEVDEFIPLGCTSEEDSHVRMIFAFDKRRETRLEAGLSIAQTIFICFAVGFGAMTFANDANKLLLNPIERMVSKMETIKDNPLEAMRLGDFEYRREEIEAAKRKDKLANMSRCARMISQARSSGKVKEPMETVILEKTIIKLGGLLALGFGEAGAEIIGQNMQHSGAGVDSMLPGQKVDAIIGFCNIRHFTECTEVLKEKVMLFVNQVGEIVHGCVDDYHGAPNKNIGDAFLLVWRLSGIAVDRESKMADMSVMSLVRIVAAINKSPVLADYRGHPGMLQRVSNYRVQMGFGLHCGWAIEGAIGSEFKIDASYLSPNVNVASRLQAATEQFGVWVLISHFMIALCSKDVGQLCRLIDHVTVKGSKQPTRLYTLDIDYMQLQLEFKSMDKVIKNRFKVRQVRELRKNDKWAEDFNIGQIFAEDHDLVAMRRLYSSEFFQRFAMAYRNYEAGEWMVARDMFYTCHYSAVSSVESGLANSVTEKEWPNDGPTETLLHYMRLENYIAPPDWPGHRSLVVK